MSKGGKSGAEAGGEPGDAAKSGGAALIERLEFGNEQRLTNDRMGVAAAANRWRPTVVVMR
jgi:hypothetical protein